MFLNALRCDPTFVLSLNYFHVFLVLLSASVRLCKLYLLSRLLVYQIMMVASSATAQFAFSFSVSLCYRYLFIYLLFGIYLCHVFLHQIEQGNYHLQQLPTLLCFFCWSVLSMFRNYVWRLLVPCFHALKLARRSPSSTAAHFTFSFFFLLVCAIHVLYLCLVFICAMISCTKASKVTAAAPFAFSVSVGLCYRCFEFFVWNLCYFMLF